MAILTSGVSVVQPATLRSLTSSLERALGVECVLSSPDDVMSYGYDAGFMEGRADLVVLPRTLEHEATAVRLITSAEAPLVPRGSGTGLCGGAIPTRGGVV